MVSRLEEFLTKANRFFNPRAGLVKRVYELNTEPDDARLHFFATDVAVTSRYGLLVDCFDHNGGAGLSRDSALAAALGETIERYACSVYFPDELPLAPYNDLPGRAVSPELLAPYSASQYSQPGFPFQPFTSESPVRWVVTQSLVDGEPVWYPAGLTYVPYVYGPGEQPIAPSVSTGMALAMTPEEAILSGVCEVVERDAVMTMWWNRLPVPEITIPKGSALAQIVAERFSVPGVSFRLFDITTDVRIPSVFCVALEENDNGCAIACGAATRPDPAQAALKALVEAAQTRAWVRSMTRQYGHIEPTEGYDNINTFEDHVRLYGNRRMRDALRFLTDSGRTVDLVQLANLEAGEARRSVQQCVNALAATGLEPLAVDVTPADVADQGLWAMKVLVPGMVGLNANHQLRFLGCRRLYEVPVRMGYRSTASTEDDLQPIPHPFP